MSQEVYEMFGGPADRSVPERPVQPYQVLSGPSGPASPYLGDIDGGQPDTVFDVEGVDGGGPT